MNLERLKEYKIPKMVKEQVQASNTNSNENNSDLILRMRGLPWSATVDDIIKFLENAKIKNGQAGVHITMSREGRPSGEAFVELETAADVDEAMKKDKQHMGHRYIEIFKASRTDMDWKLEKSGTNVENVVDECCIRLRGLPYGCTKNDITDFFTGLTIVPNGISFVSDQTGRNTGEAYVQFVNKDMVESALKKHLDRIGHRYIEIFRSSLAEITGQSTSKIRPLMSEIVARPTPYDRGDRFGGMNRFGRGPPVPPPRNQEFYEDNYNYDNTWNMRKPGPGPMREPPTLPPLGRRLSPPPAVARLRNLMYGAGQGGAVDDDWVNQNERHIIRMRGLPYRATEQDIFQFFAPLVPTSVNIILERSGRPSGEAEVEFQTYEDAEAALAKDKQNMHNRYIELFLGPKSANKQSNLSGKNMPGGFTKKNAPDSPFPRRSMSGGNAMNNSSYLGWSSSAGNRAF